MVSLKMTHSDREHNLEAIFQLLDCCKQKKLDPLLCWLSSPLPPASIDGRACNLTSFPDLASSPSSAAISLSPTVKVISPPLPQSVPQSVPVLCLCSSESSKGPNSSTQEMQRSRADGWVTSNIAFGAFRLHSGTQPLHQHKALLCTLAIASALL